MEIVAVVLGKYFSVMFRHGLKGGTKLIFENTFSHIFYNMFWEQGRRKVVEFGGET